MVLTGHEVWAHAGAYPMKLINDAMEPTHIGQMRHGNDMGCMMNPFSFINATQMAGNMSSNLTSNNKNDACDNAVVSLKRQGMDVELDDIETKRCRIDNEFPDLQKPHGTKRNSDNAFTLYEADVKRICNKNEVDSEMDVDHGINLHSSMQENLQQKPQQQNYSLSNLMELSTPSASTATPQDFNIASKNSFYAHSGIGHDHNWHNSMQHYSNSSTYIKTYANSSQSIVNQYNFDSNVDDVEFMYQATHGGSFMHHQSGYTGDDL